jgi:hypothetical protein
MPRKPSGRALTGAQRVAAYRQRQRDAGRTPIWSDSAPSRATAVAAGALAALDPNNPASLIAHWASAVKILRTVHRAGRKWLAKAGMRGAPEYQASLELGQTVSDELDRINDFEIALFNKRPPALSRAARWQNAVDELRALLDEYQQWLDNLPDDIRGSGSALVDKLEAIGELDSPIGELEAADLPQGWGRD